MLELINDRLLKKTKQMFTDKTQIDDEYQGYATEETQRLCEFAYNFI